MIYVKRFVLPSDGMESAFIMQEKRTCFPTFYPFKVFPPKSLHEIDLDGITMFYGGNGSGKSTLINVMARKVNAVRYSEFNGAPFFQEFVNMCSVKYAKVPEHCVVLTSDDVFDYALNARNINGHIDERRNELLEDYVSVHHQYRQDPGIVRMRGLDDYARWNQTMEILSPKRSQSSFIRSRTVRDVDLRSNGETAMQYFLERIGDDGLYFLDEPENSLSVEYQLQLAEYIAATARACRCQFVIATHSPILLAMKGARIYNLDEDPAGVCKWTELPNVRRFHDFFMEHHEEF